MAQHDYVIDNASGQAVRSDINNVLQAVLTNNSGTAPTTTAAYMLWADTGSSPGLLKIRDSSNGAWIKICEIVSGGIGTIANGQVYIGDGTINAPGLAFKGDTDTGLRRSSSGDFSIVVGADRKLTVDTSGNVGIGNNSPGARLEVQGDTNTGSVGAHIKAGDGGNTVGLIVDGDNETGDVLIKARSNATAVPADTDTKFIVLGDGKVGIAEAAPTEILHVNGNIKGTGNIFIGPTGTPHSQTGTTEKIRISQNEISVASDGAAGLKVNRLSSNGDAVKFFRSGVEVGKIELGTATTSYEQNSDHRLKENVVSLTDGITRVKQLQPKRFNFIVDAETTFDGFLAHEAQAVVPEAVSGTHNQVDENGDPVMQGIDQSKFVPLLTAALQEAIAKIETLETKVAALEAGS